MGWIRILLLFIRGILRDRAELAAENLALRQQLAVLERTAKCPRLRKRDRIFWAMLSRICPNRRSALLNVQPDTVVRWHRKSHSQSGGFEHLGPGDANPQAPRDRLR